MSVGVWSFGLLAAMISFLLNPEVKSSDDLPGHYWALLLGNACITLAGAGVWVILALLPARTTYALYRDEGTEQPIWVATFDHGNSDDNYVACREFARKLASGEDGNLTQLSCDSVEGLPPPVFRPAER